MVRLKDVAAAAGVHPATASRALNPQTVHLVKAETAKRVLGAAEEMDYRVNTLAANLRKSRSGLIGVVMRDFTNMMLPIMFRGIEDRLRESGYVGLLGNTYADADRKRDLYRTLMDRRVDGFIVTYADRIDTDLEKVRDAGVPLVLLNRATLWEDDICVLPDMKPGMDQIVDHLAGLGHRRIGYVGGPANAVTSDHKRGAFLEAAHRHDLAVPQEAVVRAALATDADGERAGDGLLRSVSGLTAIVCANDLIALGVMRAASKLGLSCPADLSITGFNDIPFLDRIEPPLTTARIPHYEMGVAAADHLIARIAGERTATDDRGFPSSIVIRRSTGPAPA